MAHTLPQFISGLAVSLGFGLVGVVGTAVNGDLLRRVAAGHAEERGVLPPGSAAAAAEAAARRRRRRERERLPPGRAAGEGGGADRALGMAATAAAEWDGSDAGVGGGSAAPRGGRPWRRRVRRCRRRRRRIMGTGGLGAGSGGGGGGGGVAAPAGVSERARRGHVRARVHRWPCVGGGVELPPAVAVTTGCWHPARRRGASCPPFGLPTIDPLPRRSVRVPHESPFPSKSASKQSIEQKKQKNTMKKNKR
ncbi:hypothetical protein BU14_0031s0123 [Porphyra umbilicalis]|uniref:Uncharacterized protein n=1 Tax=Porphyra umbilicalis TaxID=2786 RepID=A0A1X6PJ83_PORUM|nr:hypothetical protein BU14_0031s0123 [Porphyra umbilicalis]|eukprot:OSX80954.1 hypothetical protein BU14_0031s0123 [Porphyra umbilicalis]